jgi:hypothetical protein
MHLFLLAYSLCLCESKQQLLTDDLSLEWSLQGQNTISFSIRLNSALYSDTKWVGIGLKSAASDGGMESADIVTFTLKADSYCKDRFSGYNATYPLPDQTSSITCQSRQTDGSDYVFSWSRSLNTGDSEDFSLENLNQFRILWAVGEVNQEDGTLFYHGSTDADRGSVVTEIKDKPTSFSERGVFLTLSAVGFAML